MGAEKVLYRRGCHHSISFSRTHNHSSSSHPSFPPWHSYLCLAAGNPTWQLIPSTCTKPCYRVRPAALLALEEAYKLCCGGPPLVLLKLNAFRDSRWASCIFCPAQHIYISKLHSRKLLDLKTSRWQQQPPEQPLLTCLKTTSVHYTSLKCDRVNGNVLGSERTT